MEVTLCRSSAGLIRGSLGVGIWGLIDDDDDDDFGLSGRGF